MSLRFAIIWGLVASLLLLYKEVEPFRHMEPVIRGAIDLHHLDTIPPNPNTSYLGLEAWICSKEYNFLGLGNHITVKEDYLIRNERDTPLNLIPHYVGPGLTSSYFYDKMGCFVRSRPPTNTPVVNFEPRHRIKPGDKYIYGVLYKFIKQKFATIIDSTIRINIDLFPTAYIDSIRNVEVRVLIPPGLRIIGYHTNNDSQNKLKITTSKIRTPLYYIRRPTAIVISFDHTLMVNNESYDGMLELIFENGPLTYAIQTIENGISATFFIFLSLLAFKLVKNIALYDFS